MRNARKIVLKVGTTNLTDESSRLDFSKVERVVRGAMELRKQGRKVVLITSGAIGAGIGRMNLARRPESMPLLQAAAAVGQGVLMQVYEKYFEEYGQPVAQILLTREDFTDPRRNGNFINTMTTLMEWGVVPIVNENDTVAVEEIKLGDNDNLSALVATSIQADLLIMLSDVNGLYTGDPNKEKDVKLIKVVERVTPEIENLAGAASRGFGGMLTKVQAAKVASEFGIPVVIANGSEKDVIRRIGAGEEIGTLFLPRSLRGEQK